MKQFFVYILHSESIDKFYVGQTEDTAKRLFFHNDPEKNNIWTQRGIPWVLKIALAFPSRTEAIIAERFIKKQKSRKFIQEIIQNGWKK